MSRSVGILEINYHSQNTYFITRILKEKYDVTLFVDKDIKQRLQTFPGNHLTDVSWSVRDESEQVSNYLDRVRRTTDDLSVLFFGTITGSAPELFKFARCSAGIPTSTYIYKVYNWMAPKPLLSGSVRDIVRENLRSVARQYVVSKQNVLLSEYQTGAELISSIRNDVDVQMLRPLFRSDWARDQGSADGEFRFVVPGVIKSSRGIDYETLLEVSKRFPGRVVVELLGRPGDEYGERVVTKAVEIDGIKTHDDWIPHAEFAAAIETADALLGPFTRSEMTWRAGSRYEQRSVSVGSGITLDAIKYATPLVLPNYYEYDSELTPAVTTFESLAELPDVIERLTSDGASELQRINQDVDDIAAKYSLSKQRDRFESLVDRLSTIQ